MYNIIDLNAAISGAIRGVLSGVKAISEDTDENIQRPCFKLIADTFKTVYDFGNYFIREINFIFGYFPQNKDLYKSECYEVMDKLEKLLLCDRVKCDGIPVDIENVESAIDEGVLISKFTVTDHYEYVSDTSSGGSESEYDMENLELR